MLERTTQECKVCKVTKWDKFTNDGICRNCTPSSDTSEHTPNTESMIGARNTTDKTLCCSKCLCSMWKMKVLVNPETGKVLCSKCKYYYKKMKAAVEFTCENKYCKVTKVGLMQKIPSTDISVCRACYLFFLRTGEARVAGRKRLRRDGTVEKHHKKEKQKRYYDEFDVDSIHLRSYQRRVRDPESGSPEDQALHFSKLFYMKAMLDNLKASKLATLTPKKPLKSFRIDDILELNPTSSGTEISSETHVSDAPTPVWTQVDDEIQVLENSEVQKSVSEYFQNFFGNFDPTMMESAMKIAMANLDGTEIRKLAEMDEQQRIDSADDVCCNPLCQIEISGKRGKHPETLEALCLLCSDHLRKTNQWREPVKFGEKNQLAPKMSLACYKLRCIKPLNQRNYINHSLGKYVCWDCHKRWY